LQDLLPTWLMMLLVSVLALFHNICMQQQQQQQDVGQCVCCKAIANAVLQPMPSYMGDVHTGT
jgi:hypothetical protein